ncbi:sensor histidine kinase [Kribbella albertanoniae]|uniref:sensor histidine kinase n=1 Tax=Kribbella albertanoniae TaxID=1266829 RepID=UPI0014047545|nr:ATP-binding protein [Kribbella albertanoniae]
MGVLRSRVLAATSCALVAAVVAAAVLVDQRLPASRLFGLDDLPFLVALGSATAVGAVLAFHRPAHPVGWLFLALGGSLALTGLLEAYAHPLTEVTFITWFVLLAAILHLTPTGQPLWRWVLPATVGVGAVWFVTALVDLQPLRTVAGVLTGVGLVAAGFSLLVRFRQADGVVRRQLLWLAVAVVPLPAFVAIAFYASPDHPVLLSIATSGFIVLIPIAAGLAIAQYHLYDVERILSRAVTYLLVSGVLGFTFAAVAFTAGRIAGSRSASSIPAIAGTLAAVVLAGPLYRAFQEAVDRRFNRRRFDALAIVRAYVREPGARSVEAVLRQALHDPDLSLAYWIPDRAQWVTATGLGASTDVPGIVLRRLDRDVARITVSANTDPDIARAAGVEALPELENAGLRAAISLQLVEVRESRTRIANAQLTERRRIERDLHDGAQQRLLALALNLRAAQLNGTALPAAVDCAIAELQGAVAELRALANGLNPVGDAGLGPAVDELTGRLPLPAATNITDRRFGPAVEATAWFIICEALTNAVKHADASRLAVSVAVSGDRVVVQIEDDGRGGADANGTGLRGIADRAEAAGGSLTVSERPGGGTRVTGVLPCES